MNSNSSNSMRTVITVVILTIVGFFLWVGGITLVWFVLGWVSAAMGAGNFIPERSSDLWGMIEGCSSALGTAALIGAGVLAFRELSESASARHLEVADRLFNTLNHPDSIEARRWIYIHLPLDVEEGIKLLNQDEEGRDAFKKVLNSLDRVAFLTQEDWIPEEMIMPWMNPMIVKAWEKVGPYVLAERERRSEPDYYEAAEKLALRCIEWRKKNVGDETTWLEDAL